MKNLQRKVTRFFYNNRNKGIHNLMLYVALGTLIVFVFAQADPSGTLLQAIRFNGTAILQRGQVWRLFTYIFDPSGHSPLLLALMLFFYFQIGRILESRMGTLKFNLYYLCGILITDVAALIFKIPADIYYLNLSLMLAFATTCPEDRILLFFIIPLKMKYLAWFYFAMTIIDFFTVAFPYNLFPIFALMNYILFFGADIKHVLPSFGRYHHTRSSKKAATGSAHAAPNPRWADSYKDSKGQKAYRHKCEVCGRTDTENLDLEFRYCSRCNGYHCYCMDHINKHEHIQ